MTGGRARTRARPLPAAAALAVAAAALWLTPGARAAAAATPADRLAELSLEQLRDVVVTTASRQEERLDRVAASVYVISAEDIRRSGATTLPEALRLAPTLNVARADANQYAISARGFNNVLANKMLVLIDGRTVYSPLFSGVFWEAQDVMLEDVDRIEVVTGPNTALWGSNAVDGLIHVITRSAAATQGLLASAQTGNAQSAAAARVGVASAGGDAVRFYAKNYARRASHLEDGSSTGDAAHGVQVGLRADLARARDSLVVQGDAYQASIDQLPTARRISGVNALARWEHAYADDSQTSLQVYWDHTERNQSPLFTEKLDTLDAVAQYGFSAAGQRVVLGGGYRLAKDRTTGSAAGGFIPGDRTLAWSRVFAQDQIDLARELVLTLAASVENNPYTGAEVLPSLRLSWSPRRGGTVWGALSRAVRAPSRIDTEYYVPLQPPYLLAGGPNFRSEVADVLEIGYRGQPTSGLSYSLTLFDHETRRLRSAAPTAQGLQFENGIEGSTRGLEAWSRWRVLERWRLDAGLVWQQQKLRVSPGAIDLGGLPTLGNDPSHYASLRSALDIGPSWTWDLALRQVGALPNPAVPAYLALDSRLAWRPRPGAEVALGVQNLGDPDHAEWGAAPNRAVFGRSFYLQLRLRQ
jgi:iron complex outermembrane receptor protein